MSVPNHFSTVQEVFARGGWRLDTHDGSGQFTEACTIALHARDPRWGHLKKSGAQTQYNGHSVDGSLYLSDTPGQSTHVDYIAYSVDPRAHPSWNPDIPRYSASDWYAPTGATPAPTPHKCSLGASLFWGLGGLRENWPELKLQLREYADAKVDFVRTLIHLRAGVDGWDNIGTHAEDSDLSDLLKRYLDLVGSYGMKVEYTLLGGMKDMDTEAQQDRFVDRYANAILGRTGQVALTEIMNEYGVNGGTTHMLRRMCRRLRRFVGPAHIISLSSPNGTHGGASKAAVWAEVQQMYDGLSEANAITPHWDRGLNEPPDLGPSCPAIVICGEPRGPSSSVHETDRPADIAHDYLAAVRAKYAAYVLHSDSGVWSIYIIERHKTPDRGQWPTFSTHKNGQAILDTVKQIRLTGTWSGGTGPVDPPEPPEEPEMPLPNRGRAMNFLSWLHDYYKAPEGLQRPDGLWIDGHPDFEGIGAWGYDVYLDIVQRGGSDDDARAAVIHHIRRSAEWLAKHPGETP